eukprot:maker-scaffold1460_size40381-snap-gene-0.11 protein:Tk04336 transcript:maker-scaffold1460_size40381-snap-gene-0.11-mRNA-1 annotation:"nadh dehydrogenase 1 beta subcomplex subunit 9"
MVIPKAIITHSQRVCRLYKSAARAMEDTFMDKWRYRVAVTELRAKFDDTRKETDLRKLAAMVEAGEEEVFLNRYPQPSHFKNDPEGIDYGREFAPMDFIVDEWHPWEKARYIDYFDKRELRKKEFDEYYTNSICKKGLKDVSKQEYPLPGHFV